MSRTHASLFLTLLSLIVACSGQESSASSKRVLDAGTLYYEDFSGGLPGNWEGAVLISEGLPEGSLGAAQATADMKSQHAWVDGHFTVQAGLHFNFWARQDVAEWYQVFMFCKAPGPDDKEMNLYEAKPEVSASSSQWQLVSIPFSQFRCTMGPNAGNPPKAGEVCWMYFWAFQGRDLGMQVDRVWVTEQAPSEQPPAAALPEGLEPLPDYPSWSFTVAEDTFSSDALLDLRSLNEAEAGERGFVRVAPGGQGFLDGARRPLRFWAANSEIYLRASDYTRHMRSLAKRGINMLRYHGNITPESGERLTQFNRKERDQLWRYVAAAKKQGIYTTYSPYYALFSRVTPQMGVLDAGKGKNFGLLFFDVRLQEAYKLWLKEVLTKPNPYTGIALAEDPALAIIQLQNEDSLFWWTSQSIEGPAAAVLRRRFADFVSDKYGSLREAQNDWSQASHKDDDVDAGELGLDIVWQLTQPAQSSGQARRLADQTEFFTQTMRAFNQDMAAYLREELGCKQLINAGNWKTADNSSLMDAERYAYTANDVIGINRYYSGDHVGQHRGWAIVPGDRFSDPSVLLRPQSFPLAVKQVAEYPTIIPECNWVPPLSRQAEAPFLAASYGSLTGIGPVYWFTTKQDGYRQPSSANGYLHSLGKWVCETPMMMGQWPAAALLYRKGYVSQGQPAVREERSLEDLWFRRMPIISEGSGYDPNRSNRRVSRNSSVKEALSPLAYFVGPVTVSYEGDAGRSQTQELERYIDEQAQIVRSNTGELQWDYGQGVCTLDAPAAQGACGFLAAHGPFELSSFRFVCHNEYASVLAVSMDELPLSSSKRVLIQLGTQARPQDWKTRPAYFTVEKEKKAGELILDIGRPPWQLVEGELSFSVANPQLQRAMVLDANGMPTAELTQDADGSYRFPKDALYVILVEVDA